MYNKVELCGVDTAQLPVLSEAEKRQLLTRARAGDAAARQAMIEGNLRLVLSVVQRFAQRGENLDDLFQVGCIGLIKAIDNFDPAQPVRFSTYGVPMIIGEIRRFLRDNNALRVSRSLRDAAYKAMQAREALEKQLGREPTVDEVEEKLAAGEDFDALMEQYGQDPGMQTSPAKENGYPVSADSTNWVTEFRDAAMALENVGDVSEPVRSEYGIHIIKYVSDAVEGEVGLDAVRDALETYEFAAAADGEDYVLSYRERAT